MARWSCSANLQWVHYPLGVRDFANPFFYNMDRTFLKHGSSPFIPDERMFAQTAPIHSGNDRVAVKQYRPLT